MAFEAYHNFWRQRHTDTFLEKVGVGTADYQGLQRLVESGELLQKYDLKQEANLRRYNRDAPQLQGVEVFPVNPGDIHHRRVAQIDAANPANIQTPQNHYLSAITNYLFGGFKEMVFHQGKQREVAKGLEDIYKEYQRVQETEGRRLTVQEAARVIDQRNYTGSRATLEKLAVELQYVGDVAVDNTVYPPLATLTTPTPQAIRDASKTRFLASIPDGVRGLTREAIVLGMAAASPLGFATGYGIYKGVSALSGAVSATVSSGVRKAGATYTDAEEGWENGAQLTSRLAGLATSASAMSYATGSLSFSAISLLLASSAGFTYAANRKRQEARAQKVTLEDELQAGNPAAATTATEVNSKINRGILYDNLAVTCDALSWLGMGYGLATHAFSGGTSGHDDAPKITHKEFNNGSTQTTFDKTTTDHVGYTLRAEDDHALDKITTHLFKVDGGHPRQVEVKDIYPDNFQDRIQHMLGWNTASDGGEINIRTLAPGEYILNATATDNAGQHSLVTDIARFTVTENGHGPSPTPGPHPGPITPGDDNLAGWHINRTYDAHGHMTKHCDPSSYTNGAEHENAITFDKSTLSGKVQFDLTHGDRHTAGIDNISEDTKIFFEGYKNGHLVTAQFDNIDASGNFTLHNVDLKNYDGYQVWWAKENMIDATHHTVCVESLASVNVGNPCNLDYIVEAQQACHDLGSSLGHNGSTGLGGIGTLAPLNPDHYVCEPGPFKFTFDGLKHYPHFGTEANFHSRGTGNGMIYTLDTPGSYVAMQAGPGAVCVEDHILMPYHFNSFRLDGVDVASGTRDAFVLGHDFTGTTFGSVATEQHLSAIPQPVPMPHSTLDDWSTNPFDVSGSGVTVPQAVPMPAPTLDQWHTNPFDATVAPHAPAEPCTSCGPVSDATNYYHIDQKVIEQFLRNQYWYLDHDAIQTA